MNSNFRLLWTAARFRHLCKSYGRIVNRINQSKTPVWWDYKINRLSYIYLICNSTATISCNCRFLVSPVPLNAHESAKTPGKMVASIQYTIHKRLNSGNGSNMINYGQVENKFPNLMHCRTKLFHYENPKMKRNEIIHLRDLRLNFGKMWAKEGASERELRKTNQNMEKQSPWNMNEIKSAYSTNCDLCALTQQHSSICAIHYGTVCGSFSANEFGLYWNNHNNETQNLISQTMPMNESRSRQHRNYSHLINL